MYQIYFVILAVLALAIANPSPSFAQSPPNFSEFQTAQRYSCGKNCSEVRSCEEAVYQWCVCGYRRADADNDGVPCENHCGQSSQSNLRRIKSIKTQFDCR
ncbi:MAG: excalibur calcium-binding domain-containing protein [Thalassovita sp.]